jgi:predicted TIM-barrel fold metal-dependent hydrolase
MSEAMPHPGPIDVQTHYVPPAMLEAIERRTERPRMIEGEHGRLIEYGEGAVYPLVPAMTDLELKLREMDEGGIGMSVLSMNIPGLDWFEPSDAPSIAREANDQLAEAVAAHPDRFAALAALPMQTPEAAVAELERVMDAGLNGAMIYSNVAGRSLDEPDLRQVFDAAARLEAPILIHPTYPLSAPSVNVHALLPVMGFLFDTSTATMRLILDGVYERNPDLKLILGHAGGVLPYIIGRLDLECSRIPGGLGSISVPPSEHIKRLYVDTVSAWPPALRLVSDYLGTDRILYATDHPFWEFSWTRDAIDELDLPDADREAIETGNARRLLRIGDQTA